MDHRVLIVETGSSPLELGLTLDECSPDGIGFERAHWNTLQPETLKACGTDGIVAFASHPLPESIGVFAWLHANPIPVPTFALLPADAAEEIVQAALDVCDEFMFWPLRTEEFRFRLNRLLGCPSHEVKAAYRRLTETLGLEQIVGGDPAFVPVLEAIPRIARSDAPVLITGETGTGKEVCARAIHHLGRRRAFPFVAVDCGALPEHLLENEMFGHSSGAFTDARSNQRGLVSMSDGGTLFLDEVDSLSLVGQAKMLRLLQDHTYRPLGADKFAQADINIIAATNNDLAGCVRDKRFRADLYFRLNVVHLEVPPLRARPRDIEPLARHFLSSIGSSPGQKPKILLQATLNKLRSYDWPGNVRELFNILQRAAVFAEGSYLRPGDIILPGNESLSEVTGGSFREARQKAISLFERRYVEDLLAKHGGNVTRAAREAGKDRRAFGRLKKKYRIDD